LEKAAAEANRALEPKTSQADLPAETSAAPLAASAVSPSSTQEEESPLTVDITVSNRLGLHARPATRLVLLAARYSGARLQVTNVTRGVGPASAASINALATLGARQGHILRAEAWGISAQEALQALEDFCRSGFGDQEGDFPLSEPPISRPNPEGESTGGILQGLAVSAGIASGPARWVQPARPTLTADKIDDPRAEWQKFEAALAEVGSKLVQAKAAVDTRAGAAAAAIFEAHRLMLGDETLIAPVRQRIFGQHENAAWAWQAALDQLLAQYHSLEDPYQRLRGADLEDLGTQVLLSLSGAKFQPIQLSSPGIMMIPDLSPAAAAHLDASVVLGVASVRGSPHSHSAVLVRAQGIPMVAGLGDNLLTAVEGQAVILDGGAGQVLLNPEPTQVAEFSKRREAQQQTQAEALNASQAPAITLDGRRIEIAANIGSNAGAQAAVLAGADAVGLFRTEFLFLDRQSAPGEEEQASAYRQAAAALQGRPMIIRTLDAGGDKPLAYLHLEPEANPFLGWRAVRICLDQPEFFKTQLRAILRTAVDFPIQVMFPMIATLQEWRLARHLLQEARSELLERGFAVPAKVDTGIMIEIPAAALRAEQFAPEVDFFSIGSNDLTQYTLAAERGNPRLAALSDPFHPAVLQLIQQVVRAAHAQQKWAGVCGEMAGEPLAVPLLIGLGVDELSMNPPMIPMAKQMLRSISFEKAQEAAQQALTCETAGQVRELFAKFGLDSGPNL
jgi:phosphocarrier protein FPr